MIGRAMGLMFPTAPSSDFASSCLAGIGLVPFLGPWRISSVAIMLLACAYGIPCLPMLDCVRNNGDLRIGSSCGDHEQR